MAQVCPVVGTTNTVLPPSHPKVDPNDKEAKCPVTNATTGHHQLLQSHPSVSIPSDAKPTDASQCPALKNIVKEDPVAKAADDKVCPVVGTATTVLPPDHPSVLDAANGAECPVTKATVGHHAGKVHEHPKVDGPKEQCPVVGAQA